MEGGNSKRVLIVEDSHDIAEALQMLIEMRGYLAFVANSGSEALKIAGDEQLDLILMDLALPDLHGVSVTRELRSRPQTESTPIVCVSSYARGLEEEILDAGCNEIFSKADFMATFEPTLERYLGD